MQTKKANIQDAMLASMRQSRVGVTVFLTNGFQMRGRIHSFDSYVVILLHTDGKQYMVYKHAISTIVPERAVSLNEAE